MADLQMIYIDLAVKMVIFLCVKFLESATLGVSPGTGSSAALTLFNKPISCAGIGRAPRKNTGEVGLLVEP